jgi:hypothetical protein
MVVYFESLTKEEEEDESKRSVPLAKTSLGRKPPPDEVGPKGGHIKGDCGRMALKFEMGVGGSFHPALGMLERVAGGGSVVDSKVLTEDTNNPDPPGGEVNLYQIVG